MFSLTLGGRNPQLTLGKDSDMPSVTGPANPIPHVSSLVQQAYEDVVGASSALNPMQLFVVMPGQTTPQPDLAAASQQGTAAIANIDAALGFRSIYSDKVATALTSARTEAQAGVQWLHAKAMAPIDYTRVASPKFDAAANWLSVAGELLALEGGDPFRPFAS